MSLFKIISDIFNSIFPVKETPQSPQQFVSTFIQQCYDESTIKAKAIHKAFSFESSKDNHGLALLMKNNLDDFFAELTSRSMNEHFFRKIQQNHASLKEEITSNAIASLLQEMPHFTLIDTDDSSCFAVALETTQDMYDIDTSKFLAIEDENASAHIDAATTLKQIREHLAANHLIAVGFALNYGYLFALVPIQNQEAIDNLKKEFELDFSINRFLNKIYYETLNQEKNESNNSNIGHDNKASNHDKNQHVISKTKEFRQISSDLALDSQFKKSSLYAILVENIALLPSHLALNEKEKSLFEDAVDSLKDDYLRTVEQDLYFKIIHQESKIPILSSEEISLQSVRDSSKDYAQTTFTLGLIFESLPLTIQTDLPYCSHIAENILERMRSKLTSQQLELFDSLANSELDEYSEDLDEELNQNNNILKHTLDHLNLSIVAIENGTDDMCLIVIPKDKLQDTRQLLSNLLLEVTVINEFF